MFQSTNISSKLSSLALICTTLQEGHSLITSPYVLSKILCIDGSTTQNVLNEEPKVGTCDLYSVPIGS